MENGWTVCTDHGNRKKNPGSFLIRAGKRRIMKQGFFLQTIKREDRKTETQEEHGEQEHSASPSGPGYTLHHRRRADEQTNTTTTAPAIFSKHRITEKSRNEKKHLDNISTSRAAAPPRHPLNRHKHTETTPPTKSNTTPPPSSINQKPPIICNPSSFPPFPPYNPLL